MLALQLEAEFSIIYISPRLNMYTLNILQGEVVHVDSFEMSFVLS